MSTAVNAESDAHSGMSWKDVCEHPELRNLGGFHIDTDDWGRVIMTPVNTIHGVLQSEIATLLKTHLPDGVSAVEIAIRTKKGTKATDVAWMSRQLFEFRRDDYDSPRSPEICVEVLSPGNTREEIDEKRILYFEQGANEVWECDSDGSMVFWLARDSSAQASKLAPNFPSVVHV